MLPKQNQIFIGHIKALHPLIKKKPKGPSDLTLAILYLWQKKSFPELIRLTKQPRNSFIKNQAVIEFTELLCGAEFLDSAFWLSSAYSMWVKEKIRKKCAMHFTPPTLSTRLIENLLQNKASLTKHIWMDPASGGAAFLAPLAQRMKQALREEGMGAREILNHVSKHVIGNDIDPTLSLLSKQFLRMSLYSEIVEAKFEPEFYVGTTDALLALDNYKNKVDIVICNPPYRKMTSKEFEPYNNEYKNIVHGQPNIYSLFFKLAINLIKTEGLAGLLTPTSFVSGQYFSPLRTFLLENSHTEQIDILKSRDGIFISAQLEAAISILRKKSSGHSPPKETRVFILNKTNEFTDVGNCTLPNSGSSWPIPREKGDSETIRLINGTSYRLEDYGYKARAGSFVWNRDRRKTFISESSASKSRAIFPIIWSSDITQNGQFEFGRLYKSDGSHMYINMGREDHGSVIKRPCIALQRVTSSEQHRRLVCAPISEDLMKKFGGVIGENHVVLLEQINSNPKLSLSELASVLSSRPIDRLFRCISGAVNISIFELNQLPLPDPDRLRDELKRTKDWDEAINKAFLSKS